MLLQFLVLELNLPEVDVLVAGCFLMREALDLLRELLVLGLEVLHLLLPDLARRGVLIFLQSYGELVPLQLEDFVVAFKSAVLRLERFYPCMQLLLLAGQNPLKVLLLENELFGCFVLQF